MITRCVKVRIAYNVCVLDTGGILHSFDIRKTTRHIWVLMSWKVLSLFLLGQTLKLFVVLFKVIWYTLSKDLDLNKTCFGMFWPHLTNRVNICKLFVYSVYDSQWKGTIDSLQNFTNLLIFPIFSPHFVQYMLRGWSSEGKILCMSMCELSVKATCHVELLLWKCYLMFNHKFSFIMYVSSLSKP